MGIKQNLLELYNQSPDSQTVKIYLSGIYLLLSIQLEWANEAEDLMRKHGVCCKEFKYHWNMVSKAMDRLERSMRGTIPDIKKAEFNEEFDQVHTILTKYIFNEPVPQKNKTD